MEYIFITISIVFIVLFIINKKLSNKKKEENFYIDLKQKCLDLSSDIDYILNDTLRFLDDKKAFIKILKIRDNDLYKYIDIEGFIDEEIEQTTLLINANKESSNKLKKLETITVDKINFTELLDKKSYYIESKEEIISKYEDLFSERLVGLK